jgi:hypothetical protein
MSEGEVVEVVEMSESEWVTRRRPTKLGGEGVWRGDWTLARAWRLYVVELSPGEDGEDLGSRQCLHPDQASESEREEAYPEGFPDPASACHSSYCISLIAAPLNAPLIPANIVELPTLVKPRLAFKLQLAAIQARQNTAANLAVSSVVSGASWSAPSYRAGVVRELESDTVRGRRRLNEDDRRRGRSEVV